ncbi:MAG TPA: ring-cleaving dioxygenase [Aggregatilineaceae bacterium]|nr:ring-cleaving dioxygenase [Aggregatilineaceae bacterium]
MHGIHHVTAVSGKIAVNAAFYTEVLGLRLVKKSVNQDDVKAYHLFYADKVGTPGTDMTFFDWPQTGQDKRGTDSIALTAFRVNGQEALEYWARRLDDYQVERQEIDSFAGHDTLRFVDPEGQRLMLVDDGGAPYEGVIWDGSDVPAPYALRGFYGVMLSVPRLDWIEPILTDVLGLRRELRMPTPDSGDVTIYAMDEGGPGRELWVIEQRNETVARLGAGGVHHVAFRVADDDQQHEWHERLTKAGLPVSPVIDRFYFHSIYFRISNGILFEIATDGPGFAADEEPEKLGEKLALPPFLEPYRDQIEANLKPIVVP